MNDVYNSIYSEFEKDILQTIVQKLTFAPSISLYKMARIAIENEMGKEKFDEAIDEVKGKEVEFQTDFNRAYRRFNIILSCFIDRKNSASKDDPSDSKPVRKAKIYDRKIKEKQIAVYDNIAKKVGFPVAEKAGFPLLEGIASFDLIRHICSLDKEPCPTMGLKHGKCPNCPNCENCNNKEKCKKCEVCEPRDSCAQCDISSLAYDNIDVDALAKYAPYYYHGERDGVDFVEHIILQAIYSTRFHRDIVKLNKILSSGSDEDSVNEWLAPVVEKIESVEMYEICIDTFFDFFFDYVSDKYEALSDEYIRLLLLPEEYSKRKNAFTAVEKYEENQLQKIINSEDWRNVDRAFNLWNDTDTTQYLLFQIMPNVWKTLIGECKKKKAGKRKTVFAYEDLETTERDSVAFYCRLIRSYINESVRSAKAILQWCLKK